MNISFKLATESDANSIGKLVTKLTQEICERTNTKHFDIDVKSTSFRCKNLISDGHYTAIIAWSNKTAIAVSTITETYALYAGGKIGVIQEFYVLPEYRSSGIGEQLVEQVIQYGKNRNWSCLELCTPPLPEFERTLSFYSRNGLLPVGGRKMRIDIMSTT